MTEKKNRPDKTPRPKQAITGSGESRKGADLIFKRPPTPVDGPIQMPVDALPGARPPPATTAPKPAAKNPSSGVPKPGDTPANNSKES